MISSEPGFIQVVSAATVPVPVNARVSSGNVQHPMHPRKAATLAHFSGLMLVFEAAEVWGWLVAS